jgi:hypothetical protein
MRFEVIVPDSTRPELKVLLADIVRRLSERPELAENIEFGDAPSETPAWMLAEIDKGIVDLDDGRKSTLADVEARLAQHRAQWLEKRV